MRNVPASRSSIAPKTLGPSMRGRHIHSTAPLGATSAVVSQSDRNAYSAIGGKGLPPTVTSPVTIWRMGRATYRTTRPTPGGLCAIRHKGALRDVGFVYGR